MDHSIDCSNSMIFTDKLTGPKKELSVEKFQLEIDKLLMCWDDRLREAAEKHVRRAINEGESYVQIRISY